MSADELRSHYRSHGLRDDQFWIGPEHPRLESLALEFLRDRPSPTVLEIGFQAGGFAAPVVLALHSTPGFRYVGVDSLLYPNALHPSSIASFLRSRGVRNTAFEFYVGDAERVLSTLTGPFDLVLIDHLKPLYPRELHSLLSRRLIASAGVVLLHDVLERAERPWRRCRLLCSLYGYAYEIRDDVPGGLAVVRRRDVPPLREAAARIAAAPLRLLESARGTLRRQMR